MNTAERIGKFIVKLQELPDQKKKIILWTIVAVLAIIMGIFWIKGAIKSFSRIGENLGEIEMPKMDFSDMPEIDLQGIADQINQTSNWKDYIDTKYGFKIKIPTDWVVEQNPEELIFTTEDLLQKDKENSENCKQGKDCDAGELPYAIASFQYLNKDANKYTSDDLVSGISQVDLNNIMWSRYQPGGMFANLRFRTIDNEEKGYDFSIFWEEDEPMLRQILSTFQFIN